MVVGNCVFRVALCKVFGGGGLLWGVYWYCRPPACGVWVRALPPACVGAEVEVENPGTMLLASWALWDALVQRMLRAQDLVAPEADPFRLPCPLLLVSGGSTRSLLGAWKDRPETLVGSSLCGWICGGEDGSSRAGACVSWGRGRSGKSTPWCWR